MKTTNINNFFCIFLFVIPATLVSLSSAPTAIRAAATTYTQLLNSQSDNNVKLVILERLEKLKKYHSKVLSDLLLDILRVLSRYVTMIDSRCIG